MLANVVSQCATIITRLGSKYIQVKMMIMNNEEIDNVGQDCIMHLVALLRNPSTEQVVQRQCCNVGVDDGDDIVAVVVMLVFG